MKKENLPWWRRPSKGLVIWFIIWIIFIVWIFSLSSASENNDLRAEACLFSFLFIIVFSFLFLVIIVGGIIRMLNISPKQDVPPPSQERPIKRAQPIKKVHLFILLILVAIFIFLTGFLFYASIIHFYPDPLLLSLAVLFSIITLILMIIFVFMLVNIDLQNPRNCGVRHPSVKWTVILLNGISLTYLSGLYGTTYPDALWAIAIMYILVWIDIAITAGLIYALSFLEEGQGVMGVYFLLLFIYSAVVFGAFWTQSTDNLYNLSTALETMYQIFQLLMSPGVPFIDVIYAYLYFKRS